MVSSVKVAHNGSLSKNCHFSSKISEINDIIVIEKKKFFQNFLNFMKNIFIFSLPGNLFFEEAFDKAKIFYEKNKKEFLIKEEFNK